MQDKVFKIFIDFDGTITKRDVGEAFVNTFGDPVKIRQIVEDWIEEKITSPESWYLMFDTIKALDFDKFLEFLEEIEIDPTFRDFVEYCRENRFEIRVLSDGFDIYIKRILEREGLGDLEVYCNRAEINEGRLKPFFPYGDEHCRFCGNCKRNHLLSKSGDEDYIVYIGDGYSDKCPVQYCDFIFAKASLLKYCEVNRITYFPFRDFQDVRKKLEELRNKKRLKKRYQAELKRFEVFKQG
ncbi:MAG: MtnX-like HAD-IB family phosphatase [Bacteroidota bacterium]|jgi:2,3-diketo-5-methylthio-1-phosphopentane phosphatase|nr:MtnX-like HAD-IB family phosphatase [Ignavibacteria bacterium]MCU7498613.1 MtnX-like HAD-IB family phosphatase [Ignavibacteria bacterium]MCU7512483.1 MtnX-like HAD-IB family phosphatase [Ignavibacteria bacterium]MCU7520920.1 MtnX-like HAD-IB family phosphatase [Ignavibacteria bacterium]MCU7523598.1 MtnX-like HAD-IB family phosphatase [Ignavibacteria bacterium]